jgi:hypothetical protein
LTIPELAFVLTKLCQVWAIRLEIAMNTLIERLAIQMPRSRASDAQGGMALPFLIALGVTALLVARQAVSGVTSLTFDNDAMLRMVQVRDLLGGQSWFDLHQYRMGPEGGFVMHWSRLVDAPIAGLILLGKGVGLSAQQSEVFAAMAWPALCALATLFASMAIARRIGGLPAMVATAGLAAIGYFSLGLFGNGAIDHHGPQVALAVCVIALVSAAKPTGSMGVLAGLCAALMAGIGIETNAHVAVVAAAVAVMWLLDPATRRSFTLGFGLAFGGALAAILLSTQAPGRWTAVACDAFSIAHAAPGAAGGLALAYVAWLAPYGIKGRAIALCAVGFAAVLAALPWSLSCLRDPVADMDPVLRTMWLNGISEAMPFHRFVQNDAVTTFNFGATTVLSFIAAVVMTWRNPAIRKTTMLAALFLGLALAVALYQFRGITFGAHLAVPVLGGAIGLLWARPHGTLGRAPALTLMLLSMNTSWAMIGMGIDAMRRGPAAQAEFEMRTAGPSADKLACTDAAFFAALAGLPTMTLFNTGNHGAGILLNTHHRVMAGPYHRNVAGLKASILGFTAKPDEARSIITASGATHLLWCPQAADAMDFATYGGLAADLTVKRVPEWLAPVLIDTDGNYTLFKLR